MLDAAIQLKTSFDRLVFKEDMKLKGYFDENKDEEDADDDQQGNNARKRVGPPTDVNWDR